MIDHKFNWIFVIKTTKGFLPFILAAISAFHIVGCKKEIVAPPSVDGPMAYDIDGNMYPMVKIGTQIWMKTNLRVTHFRNGDPIPNVIDNSEWMALTSGSYCSIYDSSKEVVLYGHLYNSYAVSDSRSIAPEGWHVASDEEWKQLEIFLGLSELEANQNGPRGIDEGGKLKEAGTIHWTSPNTGATNRYGFSALPGGALSFSGEYSHINLAACFWSSTRQDSSTVWGRVIYYNDARIYRGNYINWFGFSVRCIKD
jgi:uncharacterized protein (TIGR02145 family)